MIVNSFNKLRFYPHLDVLIGMFLAIAVISVPLIFASYYFAFKTENELGIFVAVWLFILGTFPTLQAAKKVKDEIVANAPKEDVDNLPVYLFVTGSVALLLYAEFGYKSHIIHEVSIKMMLFIMKRMIGLE
jgi:putative Ca2+/H+ antiporter (TMEM165/GDT1 family)